MQKLTHVLLAIAILLVLSGAKFTKVALENKSAYRPKCTINIVAATAAAVMLHGYVITIDVVDNQACCDVFDSVVVFTVQRTHSCTASAYIHHSTSSSVQVPLSLSACGGGGGRCRPEGTMHPGIVIGHDIQRDDLVTI